MATKDNFLFKKKHKSYNYCEKKAQYSDLNLNQNLKGSIILSENYEGKDWCSKYSNTLSLNDENEKCWKKNGSSNATNNSTLSLRISAYENSVEVVATDSLNKSLQKSLLIQKQKQINPASTFVLQSPFEFQRQQNDKVDEPEVSQFKASQQLLNPRRKSITGATITILNPAPPTSNQQYVQTLKEEVQTLKEELQQRNKRTAELDMDLKRSLNFNLPAQNRIADLEIEVERSRVMSKKRIAELDMDLERALNFNLQAQNRIAELEMEVENSRVISKKRIDDLEMEVENSRVISNKRISEMQIEVERSRVNSNKRIAEMEMEVQRSRVNSNKRIAEMEMEVQRSRNLNFIPDNSFLNKSFQTPVKKECNSQEFGDTTERERRKIVLKYRIRDLISELQDQRRKRFYKTYLIVDESDIGKYAGFTFQEITARLIGHYIPTSSMPVKMKQWVALQPQLKAYCIYEGSADECALFESILINLGPELGFDLLNTRKEKSRLETPTKFAQIDDEVEILVQRLPIEKGDAGHAEFVEDVQFMIKEAMEKPPHIHKRIKSAKRNIVIDGETSNPSEKRERLEAENPVEYEVENPVE